MYIFRLAPIGTEVTKDWTTSDAISFKSLNDPDIADAPDWDPGKTYYSGEKAGRNQFIYISLKNDNTDDPIRNFIGRTPEPTKDSTFGYGQNSWLKYRLSNRFLCFNRLQPGYSWGTQGNIETTIKFRQTMVDPSFFGDGSTNTPLYLILTGLVGSNVTIEFLGPNTEAVITVIRSETITLSPGVFVSDWALNHELPGITKDTIIRKFSLYEGIDRITVKIQPPVSASRAGIGGFYVGKALKIGITQQDKLSFGMNDSSLITEDAWGHVTTNKRRAAKKISADVFVETPKADNIFRNLQHIRATPSFFLFTNNLEVMSSTGRAIAGLIGLLGVVKSSSNDKLNTRQTKLTVTVEGIPTEFNDRMLRWPLSVCGLPPLPVIPVIPPDVITPDTPPVATVAVTGVNLSVETLNATVNRTYFLIAEVMPYNAANKKVTWSNSNDAVAMITEDGAILGKAVGTTTITVTTVEGGFTDTCDVNVSFGANADNTLFIFDTVWTDNNIFIFDTELNPFGGSDAKVTGLILSINPSYTLRVGENYFIVPHITPTNAANKTVTWQSSNPDIVSVDIFGKFYGLVEGTATITATTVDGGFTASCQINVFPALVSQDKVTGISFPLTMSIPNGTQRDMTSYVEITPTNAANKTVTWQSSNTNIGSIDVNGILTTKTVGTITITATTVDGGFTASCQVTVLVAEIIRVTGITLGMKTLGLRTNTPHSFMPDWVVVSPENAANKTVTWQSSNTNVAIVDSSGTVFPKTVGTTVITATTVDGGFTDGCLIQIIAAY